MSILALALMLAAPEAHAVDIAGTWRTQNNKALVNITPCGDAWCGRIVKLLKPVPYRKSHDVNNPDPALRGRPIVGIDVLSGFHREDGEWHGRVYDPVQGKTYKSTLAADGDALRVKGCVAFFCKTQIWPRAG